MLPAYRETEIFVKMYASTETVVRYQRHAGP
jgi:hypothetical protein